MGNNFCTCDVNSSYLCDSNQISKRDIYNLSQMPNEKKQYMKIDVTNAETKPSMRYIESYTSYNLFFVLIKNIILIQRNYRSFIKRKNASKNNPKGNSTLNDTNFKVNIEVESLKPGEGIQLNQNRQLSKKQSLTSDYSNNSQRKTNYNILKDNKIKGYFLKKKVRYKYNGYLKNEKKDGFGIVTWEDGSQFRAKFSNNSSKEICKYIDSSKTIFYGVYDNNHPSGYGIYEEKNITYEGFWTNNDLNGIGIEIWKEESTFYKGEFINSIKEGIGICRWEDGTIYQGEWKNNKMNGFGMIFYPDDRIYLGQIQDDVIHGFGEFNWPDNKKYIGEYVKEKKEGFGIFIWSLEPLIAYAGLWTKGKQNGIGASINNDKVTYSKWKNGRRDSLLQDQCEIEKYLKNQSLNHWGLFKLKPKDMIKRISILYTKDNVQSI